MWFTREQFALCNELRIWGLEPRFEPGDVVARGFADLVFEEFQVLPSASLLSLTAGTVSKLPADHQGHFFWIPSVDEGITLLEQGGAVVRGCQREDGRDWLMSLTLPEGSEEVIKGDSLHGVILAALLKLFQARSKE